MKVYAFSCFKIKQGSDHINYKRAKDDFKERMGDDVYKKIVGWASILSIISFLYLIAHILSINNVIRGQTLPLDNSVISILLFIACMLLLIFVFPYAKSISFFNAIDIKKKDIKDEASVFFISCLMAVPACSPQLDFSAQSLHSNDAMEITTAGSDVVITIGASGGETSFLLNANNKWSAELSGGNRASSWVSFTPTDGNKTVDLVLKIAPNSSYEERNATIIIKSKDLQRTITIIQKQNNAVLVSADKNEFDAIGGTLVLEVKHNISFDYEIDPLCSDWIQETTTKGLITNTLSFSISKNEDFSKREGTILIKSEIGEEVVKVYQSGAIPTIVISQSEYVVGAAGETLTIEVANNVPVEMIIPDTCDWIAESKTKAMSTQTFVLNISPNSSYDPRSSKILFRNEENKLEEYVVIKQMQKDALVVGESLVRVTDHGGVVGFTVQTSGEISVEIEETAKEWLSHVETKAIHDKEILFMVEEMSKDLEPQYRSAIINLSVGSLSQQLVIEQVAEDLEKRALRAFYQALHGSKWKRNDNWLTDAPLSEWYGIFTNSYGLVSSFQLNDNNLQGDITTDLLAPFNLSGLIVNNNTITSLSLDGCRIKVLYAESIPARKVKLNNIPGLEYVKISGELETIDLSGSNNIRGLVLSECPNLSYVNITELKNLETMRLSHDLSISNIDLTNNPLLVNLDLSQCSLTSLDISSCTELQSLLVVSNHLSELDLSHNPHLQTVWAGWNELREINITNNPELEALLVDGNPIRSLDLTGCPELNTLRIDYTQIETIDLSYCPKMYQFCADYSQLSSVSFKNNRSLNEFTAIDAKLTSLDVSSCPELVTLQPYGNPIRELDLRNNPLLEKLFCFNCSLGSLDLSNNHMLKELQCGDNPITALNITNLPLLEKVYCAGTEISELDISSNYKLVTLVCTENPKLESIYIYPGQNIQDCHKDENAKFVERGTNPGLYYESQDYSKDNEVVVLQHAATEKGINIVLMGDGYSDRLISDGTYSEDMTSAFEALFTVEPMASFRDFFSVSYVTAVSKNEVFEPGASTCFSSYFSGGSTIVGNNEKAFRYACTSIPESCLPESVVIILVNSTKTAGITYSYGDGSALAYVPKCNDFRDVLIHEAIGHGLGKLLDEYSSGWGVSINEYPQDLQGLKERFEIGWGANIDLNHDPKSVKWSHFLEDSRYSGEILGIYQGAYGFDYDVYRPSWSSIMRSDGSSFNAPSREAIYKRIHSIVYGEQWEYDYETFVQYDRKNVVSSEQNRKTTHAKSSHKRMIDNGPVFVSGDWHTPVPALKPKYD